LPVHSATSSGWLSPRGRLLSAVGLGVLTDVIEAGLVDEAVGDGLAWEMRLRALPSRVGVYFVLGLCLFSESSYREVLRKLTQGLEAVLAAAGWLTPASTALTGVRRRVGERPLEALFARLCSALSPGRDRWTRICGLLAAALDGTTVCAPDTTENTAASGKPGVKKRETRASSGTAQPDTGTYPQLRMVALVTCGTRALLGAVSGPLLGKGTGEQTLARGLLDRLRPGMLLLADRGFYSFALWTAARGTGAHLLWRVKDSLHLPVMQELPDGSYLTRIHDPRAVHARLAKNGTRRRRGSKLPPDTSPLPAASAITVRVIVSAVTVTAEDGTRRTRQVRLITDLTDWRACPAAELAAGYARRWTIQTGYRELKTYLRGPGRLLRARTPELARQELRAYLVIYQAIRFIVVRAAARDGIDPARISFTAALHAVRRTVITARTGMTAALHGAETEILDPGTLVPEREHRLCPRVANTHARHFPARRGHAGPLSQHAKYSLTVTAPSQTTRTTAQQPKHPRPAANQPP
jgi:hypothetical protein